MMIHHAVLGSMGRFIGILLEDRKGHLPFWLAPDQVAVLPISDEQHSYASHVADMMRAADLRVKTLGQSETLSRRLVMAHEDHIPIQLVVGGREAAAGMVALREGRSQEVIPLAEAIERLSTRSAFPI
jgi:threonyl-tRNA synthetase